MISLNWAWISDRRDRFQGFFFTFSANFSSSGTYWYLIGRSVAPSLARGLSTWPVPGRRRWLWTTRRRRRWHRRRRRPRTPEPDWPPTNRPPPPATTPAVGTIMDWSHHFFDWKMRSNLIYCLGSKLGLGWKESHRSRTDRLDSSYQDFHCWAGRSRSETRVAANENGRLRTFRQWAKLGGFRRRQAPPLRDVGTSRGDTTAVAWWCRCCCFYLSRGDKNLSGCHPRMRWMRLSSIPHGVAYRSSDLSTTLGCTSFGPGPEPSLMEPRQIA